MPRKRKGKNPRKKAKKVKVNHNISHSNSDNGGEKSTANVVAAHPHGRTDTKVFVGDDELKIGRSQELQQSSVAESTARQRRTGPILSGRGAILPARASTGSILHKSTQTRASGWTRTALVQGTRAGKMPHPWFKKWGWWFLPLSLIGGALGAWWGVRHIEGQVQAAAPEILRAAGVDPSGLTFDADYRNIAVGGELPPGITVDEVERILEDGTGAANEDIRYAMVSAREAPPPEPVAAPPEPETPVDPKPAPTVVEPTGEISVAVVSDGQSIRLSGSVPDQQHADKLVSAAAQAVGEDNVVNELAVLGLVPSAAEPEAQINRLVQVLPQLGNGVSAASLALSDETFSGSIDTIDKNSKEQLDPIVATASGSDITVTAPAIIEPETAPLQVDVFTAYRGDKIFLYGEVLNEAQNQTLIDAAAESVGADNVLSTLKVLEPDSVSAASDLQIASLGETLRHYGGLRSAKSRLNASDLFLRGVARNDTAKETIDQSLQNGTDAGLTVDGDITLLSVEGEMSLLQQEFDALAGEIRENVVFASNSDVLDNQATEVLDKVVRLIEKFERPRIEVSGHTDSSGAAGKNQLLSARRAAAVTAYLTEQGVDVDRLRAIGVGESQPISDNSTIAGRQQNRRVELTAVDRF